MIRKPVPSLAGRGIFLLLSVFLSLAGLHSPAAASGGDNGVRILSLDEALRIAFERNRDIRKALEFRRQVEGIYVEQRASALPQVEISASVSRDRDESQQVYGAQPRSETRKASAVLSQALYTWGQVGAAIRGAKIGFERADDQLRLYRQAAARDVSASFYDVLLAREQSAIAAQTLEQKVRHLDEAQRKLAAGTATDYDVLAAEVAVENARPEVIRTENLTRTSRERLRFLLALEGQEVSVDGTLVSPVDPFPEYGDAVETAWKNRSELSELRHRLGIYKEQVTIANAGDKPRLDLKAGLGWAEIATGGSEASGTVWSAGLYLTYSIFDGLRTRGKVAQAKSEAAARRIDEAKLLDSIALETREAVNAVRESGEIVKALSGTVSQAERLLVMAEKGFEYGVKTRLEVEDAEFSMRQAKGNLTRARRDYLVAKVTLEYVKGTLGEAGESAGDPEKRWRPAESIPGMVKEVLDLQPRLDRKDDASR
jgi:HAE1 family hydrophobic/amphiphilic exporter-1